MRTIRLRTWLILGYSAVLAVAGVGLGLGLMSTLSLADTSGSMVNEDFVSLDVASRLRRLAGAQQIGLGQRLVQGDGVSTGLIPDFSRQARTLLAEARGSLGADVDSAALDKAQDAIERFERATAASARPLPADTLDAEVVASLETLRTAALEHYQHHYDRMVERGNDIQVQAERLAYALALLAAFTLAIGVWASIRIASRLSKPMEQLVRASDRVATGDFTVRTARSGVTEADRVAQRFDEMVAALQRFHSMNLDRIVAERRRLDQVVANIDDGLVIFDENGNMERVNPVAALQLGIDADAAVGQRIGALVDMPALDRDVARLLANPGAAPAADCDLVVSEEGGSGPRTLTYSLLPFSDAARLGLILVLRDVTEQRRFERLRTDFVLRASHELRTPITGMRMALGLLRDKVHFDAETREQDLFSTLQEETERLVALIGELFDLSRLYARTFPHNPAITEPDELLRRAFQRFLPVAETSGIELDLQLGPALPALQLDAGGIDRVLDNLITNAMRHTPPGGRIELGANSDGDGMAMWVQDSGEGIRTADRERIFEPFMQLNGKVGGAGLGLAMCREIVQQHRGRIQLDSALGHGSRFTVWLPQGLA